MKLAAFISISFFASLAMASHVRTLSSAEIEMKKNLLISTLLTEQAPYGACLEEVSSSCSSIKRIVYDIKNSVGGQNAEGSIDLDNAVLNLSQGGSAYNRTLVEISTTPDFSFPTKLTVTHQQMQQVYTGGFNNTRIDKVWQNGLVESCTVVRVQTRPTYCYDVGND